MTGWSVPVTEPPVAGLQVNWNFVADFIIISKRVLSDPPILFSSQKPTLVLANSNSI